MRKCGGIVRNPAGGAAVVLEDDNRRGDSMRFACSTMATIASSVNCLCRVDFQ